MPTTWNPLDLTAVTLSNGNLTSATTAAGGVRSVFSASAGKWYWEATFGGFVYPGIGMANASAVLSTAWNVPTNAAIAYAGSIYINNVSQSGAGVNYTTGDTMCIAVDITGHLIWFRNGAAGNWNNSGTANPATGTGGLSITALGTPLYAIDVANGANSNWTANFGGSTFVGAVPSGFNAFFGPLPFFGRIGSQSSARGSVTTSSAALALLGNIAARSKALAAPSLILRIGGRIAARSAATVWLPHRVNVAASIATMSSATLLQRNAVLVAARVTTRSRASGQVYLTVGGGRAQYGVTINSG